MNWNAAIEDVKLMVDLHLTEASTISAVAAMMNIPSETLRKKFFRKEGIHLNEYIYRRKVQAMKELLLISDEPCYVVCYNVGLREDSGAKVFKRIAGMTMLGFRERYKHECDALKQLPAEQHRLRQLVAEALCIDPQTEEMLEPALP